VKIFPGRFRTSLTKLAELGESKSLRLVPAGRERIRGEHRGSLTVHLATRNVHRQTSGLVGGAYCACRCKSRGRFTRYHTGRDASRGLTWRKMLDDRSAVGPRHVTAICLPRWPSENGRNAESVPSVTDNATFVASRRIMYATATRHSCNPLRRIRTVRSESKSNFGGGARRLYARVPRLTLNRDRLPPRFIRPI
jgi:hypothetical protein